MSQQTAVVDKSSHSEHRIVGVDGSDATPKILVNNCPDVHIGPKYVHNNNITINNGVHCAEDKYGVDGVTGAGASLCYGIQKCLKFQSRIRLKIIFYGSSFLFITLVTVATMFLMSQPPLPQPKDSEDYPLNKGFVTREAWGAAPPCFELSNNTMPVERVIFIHTVNSRTCNNLATCKAMVLDIQDFCRDNCNPDNYKDIMYNFLIGNDGHIFVGRGWDKIGAHTSEKNTGSIGVAFIGDFRRDVPTEVMLNSAKTLLEVGIARSKLEKDYQLFGHCQQHSGFPYSPGVNVLKYIQYFPHWNRANVSNCADFVPFESLV